MDDGCDDQFSRNDNDLGRQPCSKPNRCQIGREAPVKNVAMPDIRSDMKQDRRKAKAIW